MKKNTLNASVLPIAIDGAAASGKTTLGRALSEIFGISFLDTGLMYRAITFLAINEKVPPNDADACTKLTKTIGIAITTDQWARITIEDEDVTELLHTAEIEMFVSQYSALAGIRNYMVDLQRKFAEDVPSILAGRDIGTVVLPNAPIKFFLQAPETIRTERRHAETSQTKNQTAEIIRNRDVIDSSRTISPLRPATDAIVIETGINNVKEMVHMAVMHINKFAV
tara:strand:- start:251 stop:925 length:675 start_codon:yes stop_codon:yes gene_type:complete